MKILFRLSAFLLVYPLFIYPLLLALPFGRRKLRLPAKEFEPPFVSILLSVFNEKDVIAKKIKNFLELDYPSDKLEMLVVSDGSDDGTDAIIQEIAGGATGEATDRVRLLRREERLGKTSALNHAAGKARGDILLFTDADSMLQRDCAAKLTAPFADPEVGLVSGRSVYLAPDGRETTGSLYRRYEEWIKEREGERSGIAGADGAVYAIRKKLYADLPPEIINDLAHPIQVVLAGQRALAEPRALACEPGYEPGCKSGAEGKNEFSRQTRIMAQAWLVFFRHAGKLLAGKHYGFLWQCISHKLLRWISLPLLALFTLCASAENAYIALPALGAAGTFYFLAWRGEKAGVAGRICRLFMLQGAAAVYGLYRLYRGESFITWNPRGR